MHDGSETFTITSDQIERLLSVSHGTPAANRVLHELFGRCESTFKDRHFHCSRYSGHGAYHSETVEGRYSATWEDTEADNRQPATLGLR